MDKSLPYQVQYFNILQRMMISPKKKGESRVGKIHSRFAEQIRVDLKREFPIMDIKSIKFSNVVHELLWMIKGETNIKYLVENDCNIWNDDAYRYYLEKFEPKIRTHTAADSTNQLELDLPLTKKGFIEKVLKGEDVEFWDKQESYQTGTYVTKRYQYGDMEQIYGYQWRAFNGQTDQLINCVKTLRTNPDDRRIIVTAHNPTDIEDGVVGLPSCHNYFQFYSTENPDGTRSLSLFVNIRSNDWFLGQPYNVIQYALLTHIIAKMVNMDVDELVINSVDAHLYDVHFDAAQEWIDRYNKRLNDSYIGEQGIYVDPFDVFGSKAEITVNLPEIHEIESPWNIFSKLKASDFELTNYESEGYIKAPLLT